MRWRRASRLLGHAFLGVATGLLGYYAATNVMAMLAQRDLTSALPSDLHAAEPQVRSGPISRFEWAGWESQDRQWWRTRKEGTALGRLVCQKMGLDAVIVRGTARADLKKGPGWITYTDVPGPTGNVGISGHRTTFGAPFRHLDRLRPGDTIELYTPFRRYTYRVRKVFAVKPNRVDVVASTATPTLTLTACHPPYSARLRLVVQSDLTEVRMLAGASAAETP